MSIPPPAQRVGKPLSDNQILFAIYDIDLTVSIQASNVAGRHSAPRNASAVASGLLRYFFMATDTAQRTHPPDQAVRPIVPIHVRRRANQTNVYFNLSKGYRINQKKVYAQ